MSNDRHELPEGTRDSVIERHVMRALSTGAMTREGYADEVRRIYWAIVPEKARKVRFTDPETHPKPSTALASNAKLVFRFWDDAVSARMPSAIEDAMAYALPEPYSTHCRQELARRLGCYGAMRQPMDVVGDLRAQGQITGDMGEVMMIMARMRENGRCIHPGDKPMLPEFEGAIDRLMGDAQALKLFVREATCGRAEEPTTTQLRSVS